jgi:hypothetical protein
VKVSEKVFIETVKGAYSALEYACERSCGDAEKILYELREREANQEKGHRRMAGDASSYRFSIGIMVKYFTVRATLAAIPAPKSWAEYASYNTRAKLGQELKATLVSRSPEAATEFANDPRVLAFLDLGFDYATDGVVTVAES